MPRAGQGRAASTSPQPDLGSAGCFQWHHTFRSRATCSSGSVPDLGSLLLPSPSPWQCLLPSGEGCTSPAAPAFQPGPFHPAAFCFLHSKTMGKVICSLCLPSFSGPKRRGVSQPHTPSSGMTACTGCVLAVAVGLGWDHSLCRSRECGVAPDVFPGCAPLPRICGWLWGHRRSNKTVFPVMGPALLFSGTMRSYCMVPDCTSKLLFPTSLA